jgi:hypothetical protein
MRVAALLIFGSCLFVTGFADRQSLADETQAKRNNTGLLALYDFGTASGAVVKDRSGVGRPVDLRVVDPKAVRRTAGSLEIRSGTIIRSNKPASKIIEAIRKSNEISIEAWIQPANLKQEGPARIVTLSRSPLERNVTLGQEKTQFEVRLRTSRTSNNGIPATTSPNRSVTTRLTHVVYTRNRVGRAQIYVNGKQVGNASIAGDTLNWHGQFRLALGNELDNQRPWLGTYYLVAVYRRALDPKEVLQNFKAGGKVSAGPELAQNLKARHFESKVAPLLARHCLECHDTHAHKGGLDLSKKQTAFVGGETGKAIVSGKLKESLLWDSIESGEMPKKRPPLSADEKTILRKWIESGATWSVSEIDPANYIHDTTTAKNWVRRLTVSEYIETVRSAVGVDIANDARRILPKDVRADGFSNTAYNLNIDLKHIDGYSKLAEIIVGRMNVEAFARKYSRSKRLIDDDMRALIAKMGKWLLRGPLEDNEITIYRGISTTVASAGGDFKEAVSLIIEAMLQSPRFIYRIENQQGDGTAWPVGSYELASRLSYILWGAPPDEELLRAADNGQLDEAGVKKQVERMLKDPRVITRSSQFISQWLNLDRLDNLSPNAKRFPKWNAQLANDMRAETLAFFEEVAWKQKRPISELLNSQVTFATPGLARHYGLPVSKDAEDTKTLIRYDVSKIRGRGGLLTHGSVLTVGGDEASMVSRGLFVLNDLLRGVVKDPPPCVDTTPVPTKAGLTQRGIAEQRLANNTCGGCHSKFEPLAFGLEKFDGIGAFHDANEHGNKLRDDGDVLFPGAARSVRYANSTELMDLLAKSDRVKLTLTWKVTQFALGRPLGAADAATISEIHKTSQQAGGTYEALIKAICTSDLVSKTRTETPGD